MSSSEASRASEEIWAAMAPGWDARHAYFEQRARPVAERMLERLAPGPGQTVLDLAAGTGLVGFAASPVVGPSGHVVVSDFAAPMVEAAARRARELGLDNVECRALDAQRLDLPDASVDGILCRWGFMLMPEPLTAFSESRRVLRRGGVLSLAVFAGPETNPWSALPAGVLAERGHMAPPDPGAPGIHALADTGRLRDLLARAGFSEPVIEEVPLSFGFAGPDDYWGFLTDAAGVLATVLLRLDVDERERVREEISRRLRPFAGPSGIELPAVSLVASTS